MVANLGETGSALAAGSRAAAIQQLCAAFADALDYRQNKSTCERGDWRDYSVSGADLEVLVSVLDGERAMVFNADRASNIEVAMGLASNFNLGAIIIGGAEA